MRRIFLISILLALLIVASCKNSPGHLPEKVAKSILAAGDNGNNLKKVLLHYKNDSLKYQAACFLIENMPGHYSVKNEMIEFHKQALDALPDSLSKACLQQLKDELSQKNFKNTITVCPDIETVTSSFLIEHIDDAFQAWQSAPWSKDVTFETFCKYILPYRVNHELLDSKWRKYLRKQFAKEIEGVTDINQAFGKLLVAYEREYSSISKYPYSLDVISMKKGRFAICEQRTIVRCCIMRAFGIPVTYDYTERWANYSRHSHAWVALIGKDEQLYILERGDSVARIGSLIDASYFKPTRYPDSSYIYNVDTLKRIVKVYRKNFFGKKNDGNKVDVSASYGLTDSIVLRLDNKETEACLCTFRTGDDWQPAVYGKVSKKQCVFRNIGSSVIYLPAILKEGKVMALDAPFLLLKGGETRKIVPTGRKQTVVLTRKHVLMADWTNRWYEMQGGRFEASNDCNFSRAELLHCISDLPVYRNEVALHTPHAYRYVRYVSPDASSATALAELLFYNEGKELTGSACGEGIDAKEQYRVFDHDYMSRGNPTSKKYWVGLDFGKPCHMDKLVYYPHNDDNFIVPGELYELFYYDQGEWHSLGECKATSERLIYTDVPEGALFLLKNKSKGIEERIFTYEKGKQIWW